MKANRTIPPKLPLRFFRWYCHPEYQEDIEGDLLERFERRLEEREFGAAKWGVVKDVFLFFRPGFILSMKKISALNHYAMSRHSLLLAFVNFGQFKSPQDTSLRLENALG